MQTLASQPENPKPKPENVHQNLFDDIFFYKLPPTGIFLEYTHLIYGEDYICCQLSLILALQTKILKYCY
jgi:hypothetical protein